MFPFESVAYAQAGGAEANPFRFLCTTDFNRRGFLVFPNPSTTKEAEGTPEDDQRTRQR